METTSITLLKTRHLLAHILMATGARRWPQALQGESGATVEGFFADFGIAELPGKTELGRLAEEMARVLADFRVFRDVQLTLAEAQARFAGQAWKQRAAAGLAATAERIGCYELDGFLDLCDCTLKDAAELRAVRAARFRLTGAAPVLWQDRAATRQLVRISGEVVAAAA